MCGWCKYVWVVQVCVGGVNDRFVPYKTSSPCPIHLWYPSVVSICLVAIHQPTPSPPTPHPSLSPHPYPWPFPSPPLVVLALVHAHLITLNHHVRGACVMWCLRDWDTLVIGTACVMRCLRHSVTFAPIPMSLDYTYLYISMPRDYTYLCHTLKAEAYIQG